MKILSSYPFYIKPKDLVKSNLELFVNEIQSHGYFTKRITSNCVVISSNKNSTFNNIVVYVPGNDDKEQELAVCKFYNADDSLNFSKVRNHNNEQKFNLLTFSAFNTGVALVVNSLGICFGNDLVDHIRILKEPFCSDVLRILLKHYQIFKCPKCGKFSFKRDYWKREDPIFSEERISHGFNAIANILFLGGHGAGGEWSQATKQRHKYNGYNLSCVNCGHVNEVTTDVTPI